MDENKCRDTEEDLMTDIKGKCCPDETDKIEDSSMLQAKCSSKPNDEVDLKNLSCSKNADKNDGITSCSNYTNDPFALDIDNLINEITKKFNDRCHLTWMKENSGSHYSGVRQADRDEFDFMFYPTLVQCRIEPCHEHPCYCRVFITDKHKLPLGFQEILTSDDELIPSKFRDYVFPVFDKIITEFVFDEGNKTLNRIENKTVCPAYTFEYVTKFSADNVNIMSDSEIIKDIDLVPCLRIQDLPPFCMQWESKKLTQEEKRSCPIYVVPKKFAAVDEELELWRISFSAFEQKILRDKCDWVEKNVIRNLKDCLRYKRIDDENNKLCSYHITTNCLHFFEKTVKRPERGLKYLKHAIDSLIAALKLRDIRHFFMPDFNLLQDVDVKECDQFIWKLENHRKGKPI